MEDQAEYRTLQNGAVQDVKTGRFVKGFKPNTALASPSQARELAQLRYQQKRERIAAGALAAVREKLPDRFDGVGDDWIEAVAEAVARKALDRLDPKQVDAARFLLTETGLSDRQAEMVQEVRHVYDVDDNTRRLLLAIAQAQGAVVDAPADDDPASEAGGGE